MNELALVVVNDGNGDQCGYSYQERLEVARLALRTERERHYYNMVWHTRHWHREHEMDVNHISVDATVQELDAYYQQHLAEGA